MQAEYKRHLRPLTFPLYQQKSGVPATEYNKLLGEKLRKVTKFGLFIFLFFFEILELIELRYGTKTTVYFVKITK